MSSIHKRKLIHRHLTPELLARYLYPKLAAYKNADALDIPRLNLSQRTLLAMYGGLCRKPNL